MSFFLKAKLNWHFQTSLPKGVKQKTKKAKPQGPKRGHNVYIAPKKQHLIQRVRIFFIFKILIFNVPKHFYQTNFNIIQLKISLSFRQFYKNDEKVNVQRIAFVKVSFLDFFFFQDKIEAEVTKVINEKNEELAKGRIDAANGKIWIVLHSKQIPCWRYHFTHRQLLYDGGCLPALFLPTLTSLPYPYWRLGLLRPLSYSNSHSFVLVIQKRNFRASWKIHVFFINGHFIFINSLYFWFLGKNRENFLVWIFQ